MRRKGIIILAVILFSGCLVQERKDISVQPEKQPIEKKADVLPPEPPEEDLIQEDVPVLQTDEARSFQLENEGRRYHLDLQSGDVKDVLLALVRDTQIGLIVGSEISGTIPVMDLKDATLKEILDYILPPLNLKYQWKGKNIYIYKDVLITRYFNLNYLSASRSGKRKVSYSTRSGGGGGTQGGGMSSGGGSGGGTQGGSSGSSGSSGGGQNQSTNEINVNYENTVWKTFIDSLKVLVFGQISGGSSVSATGSGQEQSARSFAYGTKTGKKLIVSPETGIVLVTAYDNEIKRVAEFIETYEGSAQRQVWIEAKIVEVNLSKGYQMGIDWGKILSKNGYYPTGVTKRTLPSTTYSFTAGDIMDQELGPDKGFFQFAMSNNIVDFALDAISKQGNLKVLASPRISTLNNEKAVIRVVREEVFFNLQTQISQGMSGNISAPTIFVQVVPIGIVMDIIPQINDNDHIMLSVNPDISELLEVRRFEVSGAMATQPVIDRRSIDTTAKLRSGQTLVIAGIIKEKKQEILKGIPVLYKIPILGNLFRRTEQKIEVTELVIFITPRIIVGKSADALTKSEWERIERSISPLHLGDTENVIEGLKGEIYPYIKDIPKESKKKKE